MKTLSLATLAGFLMVPSAALAGHFRPVRYHEVVVVRHHHYGGAVAAGVLGGLVTGIVLDRVLTAPREVYAYPPPVVYYYPAPPAYYPPPPPSPAPVPRDPYDQGYYEGYREGYDQGLRERYQERYQEGRRRGYEEGYKAGKEGHASKPPAEPEQGSYRESRLIGNRL